MQRCDICSKSFASRQNLIQQRRKTHSLNKNEHEIISSSCGLNCETPNETQVQLASQHNAKTSRISVYYRKTFTTESEFRNHLKEQHSPPMRNQTDNKGDRTFSSAFNNTFNIFRSEAGVNHVLL